jgi:hypothetical protein
MPSNYPMPLDRKPTRPEIMLHCYNCGAELGMGQHWPGDEPECCERMECMRALRNDMAAQESERQQRAEEDRYGRY